VKNRRGDSITRVATANDQYFRFFIIVKSGQYQVPEATRSPPSWQVPIERLPTLLSVSVVPILHLRV